MEEDKDREENKSESNQSNTIKTHEKWVFNKQFGVNYNMIMNLKNPVEYYQLFCTNQLLDVVVTKINNYRAQRD